MNRTCRYDEIEQLVVSHLTDEDIKNKVRHRVGEDASIDNVYMFAAVASDNSIDRDLEFVPSAELDKMSNMYIGKSGVLTHKWEDAIFSIVDTDIIECYDKESLNDYNEKYKCLVCYCYTLDDKLRDKIKYGIANFCSASFDADMVCNICGKAKNECMHEKGKVYDGRVCHGVLLNIADVYELSIVSVPANTNAKIIKKEIQRKMKIKKEALANEENKPCTNETCAVITDECKPETDTENKGEGTEPEVSIDDIRQENETLKAAIEELRRQLADAKACGDNKMKEYSIKRFIGSMHPVNEKAAAMAYSIVDKSKIQYNSDFDIVCGLKEQLDDVKFLFKSYDTKSGTENNKGVADDGVRKAEDTHRLFNTTDKSVENEHKAKVVRRTLKFE